VRILTLHFWSLVLGAIAPLVPYFIHSAVQVRAINVETGMNLSPWVPAIVLGPLAVFGLGTVGALLSFLLKEWPRRPLHRFLLGAGVGTSFCLAGQLGLFQRGWL
jgi:hypothetical protein